MLLAAAVFAANAAGWRVVAFAETAVVLQAACPHGWVASIVLRTGPIDVNAVCHIAKPEEGRHEIEAVDWTADTLGGTAGRLHGMMRRANGAMRAITRPPQAFTWAIPPRHLAEIVAALVASNTGRVLLRTLRFGNAWHLVFIGGTAVITIESDEVRIRVRAARLAMPHGGSFDPATQQWPRPPDAGKIITWLVRHLTSAMRTQRP